MSNRTTCKDCLHFGICRFSYDYNESIDIFGEEQDASIRCNDFSNKAEWVYLQCEVGDKVFWLQRNYYEGGYTIYHTDFATRSFIADAWLNNIKLYKTYEDAKKALEGDKKNGNYK